MIVRERFREPDDGSQPIARVSEEMNDGYEESLEKPAASKVKAKEMIEAMAAKGL